MPLPDPRSRARLAEMGIDVWLSRKSHPGPVGAGEQASLAEARVRLAAGDGRWLLVQRRPWDGRHAELLGDIQALLGPEQCRFGHWADSREAGIALSELSARGIVHVLAFGPIPQIVEPSGLVLAPALDELAGSGAARRQLWQALRPRLAG